MANELQNQCMPTSGMDIQECFAELVAAARAACDLRFGSRLLAAYVGGSVARGEAWPGASDLDWFAFTAGVPTGADRSWRYRMQTRLEQRYPVASEVHLNVFPIRKLADEPFWRFILKYNATRLSGDDILVQLESEGIATPKPSAAMSKGRLPFVRRCLAEAIAGRRIPALAELPDDPALATRKLVRNFVIVEGAHYLMAIDRFETFSADSVLKELQRWAPQWTAIYDLASRAMLDPYDADTDPRQFMEVAEPFVEWMISAIEKA